MQIGKFGSFVYNDALWVQDSSQFSHKKKTPFNKAPFLGVVKHSTKHRTGLPQLSLRKNTQKWHVMHPKQLMFFKSHFFLILNAIAGCFLGRLLDIYFFSQGVFFWSRKKPRDFDSIPGCFGGGTLEAGRREQETFSLVQPKAQAPDTTPEPLADESPRSMKMEKELFGVRMRTWRLDHQGVKCFFSPHT